MTRHLRPLSLGLILLLLILSWIAWRRLRASTFNRRNAWLFAGLAIFDLVLVVYSLFIRLPNNDTSVRQVIRFEPDLGLMLLVILLLSIGWGSVRSVWAFRRWQKLGD